MAFPGSQQQHQQSSTSDLWLRYPDNVGIFSQITFEHAITLLTQAIEASQRIPFAFSFIDKPPDGQAYLVHPLNLNPATFPPDGIRYLEQEKSFRIPAGHCELEVCEVKFGFVPNQDATASRFRRRYRLTKGGNPQLMLLHYLRAEQMPIPPQLMNVPVRVYPLRLVSEPRLFVAGERMGQRIPVQTPGPPVNGIGPVMSSGIPPATMTQTNPMLASGVNPMAMNTGLGLGIGAAQLTHQNRTMDTALASSRPVGPIAAGGYSSAAGMPGASSVAPNIPKPPEEDESGDEYELVTTRTLAVERFKRNHELMAEVFTAASKGLRSPPSLLSPYDSLKADELDTKVETLTAEVDALKRRAEARRQAQEAAAQSMEVETSAILMAS